MALKLQGDFCDRKVFDDATLLIFADHIGVEGEGIGDARSPTMAGVVLRNQWKRRF
jgi:hypothetical protein